MASSITHYTTLVARWVDLDDPDSKNMLRSITEKICKDPCHDQPQMKNLTNAVKVYLTNGDDRSIQKIKEVLNEFQ